MGDRGQVGIRQYRGSTIYLYTHWGGYELASIVREALASEAGRNRLGDPEYLARIIFDRMTGLEGGETGYGIGTEVHGDIEHNVIVVDGLNRTVEVYDDSGKNLKKTISVQEFIDSGAIDPDDLDTQRGWR